MNGKASRKIRQQARRLMEDKLKSLTKVLPFKNRIKLALKVLLGKF